MAAKRRWRASAGSRRFERQPKLQRQRRLWQRQSVNPPRRGAPEGDLRQDAMRAAADCADCISNMQVTAWSSLCTKQVLFPLVGVRARSGALGRARAMNKAIRPPSLSSITFI